MLRRHDNAFASHQARNNEHNIEDHDSTLRRIDNLLASRRARNSQHNTEYHNSQHEHGSATDNSDDDLLSDRSSQVRRGRSLRRARSNLSDAFSEVGVAITYRGNIPENDEAEDFYKPQALSGIRGLLGVIPRWECGRR